MEEPHLTAKKEKHVTFGPTQRIFNTLKEVFEAYGIDLKYLQKFEENDISLSEIPELSSDDLKVVLPHLLPRKKLKQYINSLKSDSVQNQEESNREMKNFEEPPIDLEHDDIPPLILVTKDGEELVPVQIIRPTKDGFFEVTEEAKHF
eukprot:TRINITY_DN6684_c0_g1_i1.p1 TRINITY_DN6684_c0_g1~~TRINITY_DN6684_c0_g1_i1.p1  ORF type:complete len:148 (-),score=37.81 TRINITY_DN6684_c0_g1_i1:544-987(-)